MQNCIICGREIFMQWGLEGLELPDICMVCKNESDRITIQKIVADKAWDRARLIKEAV